MRAAAAKSGQADDLSLWAGKRSVGEPEPTAAIVARVMAGARAALNVTLDVEPV